MQVGVGVAMQFKAAPALLPIQLPAGVPGTQQMMAKVKDLYGVPSSCLWPWLGLAKVDIWGMNQWIKVSVCVSFSTFQMSKVNLFFF